VVAMFSRLLHLERCHLLPINPQFARFAVNIPQLFAFS